MRIFSHLCIVSVKLQYIIYVVLFFFSFFHWKIWKFHSCRLNNLHQCFCIILPMPCKNVSGNMLGICASAQFDQDLNYLLTESLDTTECMNGEQRLRWYFAHVQNDMNLHILHRFKGLFFACRSPYTVQYMKRAFMPYANNDDPCQLVH